jgi:hypothetical protein
MSWQEAVLGLIGFSPIVIIAAISAARHSDEAWALVGEDKTLWIATMLGGYFLAGLGMLVAFAYFVTMRLKLENAEKRLAEAKPAPH